MEDKNYENRRPGKSYREVDRRSGQEVTRRINPRTGVEEQLVQGVTGQYWQDRSRISIDEHGTVTDWEG